jgi:hypothetical protein
MLSIVCSSDKAQNPSVPPTNEAERPLTAPPRGEVKKGWLRELLLRVVGPVMWLLLRILDRYLNSRSVERDSEQPVDEEGAKQRLASQEVQKGRWREHLLRAVGYVLGLLVRILD